MSGETSPVVAKARLGDLALARLFPSGSAVARDPEAALFPVLRGLVASPHAIDIGAHVGDTTLALRAAGFETWALEPNPAAFRRLSARLSEDEGARALNLAASSTERVLDLNLAAYGEGEGRDEARDALYSTLRLHPGVEGLRFEGTTSVVAWPLDKIARTGMIPRTIGLLKVDAEGHDPEVLRGLGDLEPEIVMVEFWNEAFPFNAGQTGNDLSAYLDILRPRGFAHVMALFRLPDGRPGYGFAQSGTPRGTWGNLVFVRSARSFRALLRWAGEAGRGGEAVPASGPWDALPGFPPTPTAAEAVAGVRTRFEALRRGMGTTLGRSAATLMAAANKLGREAARPGDAPRTVDLVITPNEITVRHGTGVLLKRLLDGQPDVLAMRSRSTYRTAPEVDLIADLVLPDADMDRADIAGTVAAWLRGYSVRRILCVPYYASDLVIALTARLVTGVPLGLYVMDDNCLHAAGEEAIPRALMAEAVRAAEAAYAISPELARDYEGEFRSAFHVVPPLVATPLLRTNPSSGVSEGEGLVLGNIWGREWIARLAGAVEGSGETMDWLTANPHERFIGGAGRELARAGVRVAAQPPTAELIARVTAAPFVVVPSGTGEEEPGNARAIARLSLPSRMVFTMATSGTPLLVLGGDGSAAARFVRRFGLGEVCPYEPGALREACARLRDPATQAAIRARAAALAPRFDVAGAYAWLSSVTDAHGHVAAPRFADLFRPLPGEYSVHVPRPAPPWVYVDFREVYAAFDRLKAVGYAPDFVIDAGASTGVWSLYVAALFPHARFVLADPMTSRYGTLEQHPALFREEVAVSDAPGRMTFKVSNDLYNSSLLGLSSVATLAEEVEVEVVTVDGLVARHRLTGRGVLKVDVQYAEHLVLTGAAEALAESIDLVVLELTLTREHPGAKTLAEMIALMDDLGFRPFDDVGGWRDPRTGFLDQKDLVFCREDFAPGG